MSEGEKPSILSVTIPVVPILVSSLRVLELRAKHSAKRQTIGARQLTAGWVYMCEIAGGGGGGWGVGVGGCMY